LELDKNLSQGISPAPSRAFPVQSCVKESVERPTTTAELSLPSSIVTPKKKQKDRKVDGYLFGGLVYVGIYK
jgi:hypothetical protein